MRTLWAESMIPYCPERWRNIGICLYLESDLLGQLSGSRLLCSGTAVGAQSQEGRAHGGTTALTDEVLGPAQKNPGEVPEKTAAVSRVVTVDRQTDR